MKIRFAVKEDIPTILDLGELMAAESRFREYGFNRAKTDKVLETMIDQPDRATLLVAERTSGEMVGMLGGYVVDYFFSDVLVAQDRFFFVKPEARGSSAAMKLLSSFRRWAEIRKARELNINMSVAVDIPRFNKMMIKLGFMYCGSNFTLMNLGNPSKQQAAVPPL